MPQDAATHENSGAALFIDMDGLLRKSAEAPQEPYLPAASKLVLHGLRTRLDGALALISGRRIADLDVLLAPYRFCCAGVHGCETRDPTGQVWTHAIDVRAFESARAILSQLIERHPALLLEQKGCALVLHFEHEPRLRILACTAMKSAANVLGAGFRLRTGRDTYEIHPSAATPATAIAAFMEQAPFRGRTPVLIGDDATDEDAFTLVRGCRGLAVNVGESDGISTLIDTVQRLDEISPVLPPQSCRCGWNPRDF